MASRVDRPAHLSTAITIRSLLVLLYLSICLQFPTVTAATPAPSDDVSRRKVIALTFDDGPRPYVLKGRKAEEGGPSPGLIEVLDREKVKATFFVMGFRLADSANDFCRKIDVGMTCREAAVEAHRRGHEIENHTYGHGPFTRMKKRYGEDWILNDIDRASKIIHSVTGEPARYLRPPEWDLWPDLQTKIENRGYVVMMKSSGEIRMPAAREDVDTQDYVFTNLQETKSPVETLRKYVLERIAQREKRGVYTHILVFHELPISTTCLLTLIPDLKQEGYEFLTLRDFMKSVSTDTR